METKPVPAPHPDGDEVAIRFDDVLRFLWRYFWMILGSSLAGLVAGVCLTFVIPKQWEATGILQIGQVANEVTPASPIPIEPPARALERVRMPQFVSNILTALGEPVESDGNATSALIRRSLKSTPLSDAELIQFAVRGYSPEEARRAAQAVADEVTRVHAGLMRPTLDKLNADLAEVEQGMITEEKRRDALSELAQIRGQAGIAGKFSENVLLSEMLTENDKALRLLRLRKNALREFLTKERTFNTRLLGPIEVNGRNVYPRQAPFGAAGLAIGLLLSLLVGTAIEAKRRMKQL